MRGYEEEFVFLKKEILDAVDLTRELADEDVRQIVEEAVSRYSHRKMLTLERRGQLEQFLFN